VMKEGRFFEADSDGADLRAGFVEPREHAVLAKAGVGQIREKPLSFGTDCRNRMDRVERSNGAGQPAKVLEEMSRLAPRTLGRRSLVDFEHLLPAKRERVGRHNNRAFFSDDAPQGRDQHLARLLGSGGVFWLTQILEAYVAENDIAFADTYGLKCANKISA